MGFEGLDLVNDLRYIAQHCAVVAVVQKARVGGLRREIFAKVSSRKLFLPQETLGFLNELCVASLLPGNPRVHGNCGGLRVHGRLRALRVLSLSPLVVHYGVDLGDRRAQAVHVLAPLRHPLARLGLLRPVVLRGDLRGLMTLMRLVLGPAAELRVEVVDEVDGLLFLGGKAALCRTHLLLAACDAQRAALGVVVVLRDRAFGAAALRCGELGC